MAGEELRTIEATTRLLEKEGGLKKPESDLDKLIRDMAINKVAAGGDVPKRGLANLADVFSPKDAAAIRESMSPADIAKAMDSAMEEVGATPQEKMGAYKVASSDIETPTRAETRRLMTQNPDATGDIINAISSSGGSKTEALGEMLSKMLPALVGIGIGAAVGGKKGAARGAIGAGSETIKQLDEERKREEEAERRRTIRLEKMEDAEAKSDISLERQKELADYKQELKDVEKSAKKADWWKDVPSDDKKKLSSVEGDVDGLMKLAEDFEGLGDGVFDFQIGKKIANTDASRVFSRLEVIIPRLGKQYGDTGNFAVAERKMILDAMTGGWTASGRDVADRLRAVARDLASRGVAVKNFYISASGDGTAVSDRIDSTLKTSKAIQPPTESQVEKIKTLRGQPVERVLKGLKKAGIDIDETRLEEIWGNQ